MNANGHLPDEPDQPDEPDPAAGEAPREGGGLPDEVDDLDLEDDRDPMADPDALDGLDHSAGDRWDEPDEVPQPDDDDDDDDDAAAGHGEPASTRGGDVWTVADPSGRSENDQRLDAEARARPRRRIVTPRRVMATVGLAVYGVGWLMPHTSLDDAVVVTIPLVTAESAPAATLPVGLTRSQAAEASTVQALRPGAVVEFDASGTSDPIMRVSLPGCRPDDGCGARFADTFRSQRIAAIDVAVGARSTQLPALIADAGDRLDQAKQAAGDLATMTATQFTELLASGEARNVGTTWQQSFDQISGYQWMLQEEQLLASLEAERSGLRQSASRVVGDPVITSSLLPARGAARAVIVSGAGGLLVLAALASGRKRYPARPTGLRSGIPALLARSALVLIGASVLSIGVEGLALYREGRDAIKKMELIRNSIASGDFETADREVKGLEALMTHAREMIDQPPSQVLRILPGGSYHRRQSLTMVDVFGANLTTARVLIDEVDGAQRSALPYSERAARIKATLTAAAGRLRTIDDPVDILSGADEVRIAHDDFVVEARRALADGAATADVVNRVITERQRFLLLVGSTTEPRAATGAVGMVGTLRLGDSGPVVDGLRGVAPDDANALTPILDHGVVPDDMDIARTLAGFAAGSDWTTVTLSPRFDAAARTAAQMWEASSSEHIDGVLYLDVVGMQHLLRFLGPVTVGDRPVSADDIVQYAEVGQFAAADSAAAARQDGLRDVVNAVIERLGMTAPSTDWISELGQAVKERHVMLWTPDPAQGNSPGGATGRLRPDSLSVSVAPMNGRYDPYVTVSVAMQTSCLNGTASVTLDVERSFERTPTADQIGSSPWFQPQLDTSLGLFVASLPAASSIDQASASPAVISGPDGPTRRYATWMETAQGTTSHATLRFDLPAGSRIHIEPSGRSSEQRWTLDDESWDSTDGPRVLDLPRC